MNDDQGYIIEIDGTKFVRLWRVGGCRPATGLTARG